jgi:hypothetical protein
MCVGLLLREGVAVANRYCSKCGHELQEDARFCPNCGKAVHEVALGEASKPDSGNLPFEVTSSPFFGGWPRTTILAFHNRVVVRQKAMMGRVQETTIRYEQIAAMNVRPGMSHADVIIETTGGAVLRAKAVPEKAAWEVSDIINERL